MAKDKHTYIALAHEQQFSTMDRYFEVWKDLCFQALNVLYLNFVYFPRPVFLDSTERGLSHKKVLTQWFDINC